jgi:putative glutamine amidotransferase
MRPLIGVTTSELRASAAGTLRRHGEPPHPEMALGMTYLRAIDAAGGTPLVLPPLGDAEAYLERLDGVCLSGGPDLDPMAYGAAERHAELGPTEPDLDAFELALARAALERGMPVLGVCRGAQALNVALGGTLHQHLPDLSEDIEHRQQVAGRQVTHEVKLAPDSHLAKLMGRTEVGVNSFHHQAPATLGPGLRVVGRAKDGIVEAVESTGPGFVCGVQWHAECLVERPEHFALFEGLVQAGADSSFSELRAA